MSAPSWPDLEALFHEALGRAPGDRATFLAARCAGHPDLQAEVEALLRAHDTAASALEVPPVTLPTRLQAGARLGPYEVLSELGAGGMGEVYRARDTKLGRHVALKVLPVAFAADADRLARFTREARTLASLNHPGIAIVHELEQAGDVCALVMELVEGEDLSAQIARGPIPLDVALPLARQIAEALEAAHEQGIIHRDLKPANIKVRADGTVKVLDFGLAKLADTSRAGSVGRTDVSRSPTLSPAAMTGMGVILGTAAYMAPEQARGQMVDKRADIWAFGAVLYEMVTGRRLFGEETVSDTLAAVLKETPAWEGVPAEVLPLLRRCLEKDPRRRLRDIGDAMTLLVEAPQAAIGSASARRVAWVWPGVAALLVIALASLAIVHYRERPPTPPAPTRFQILPPEKVTLGAESPFAISPDGRTLVFGAAGSDNVIRLWLRALDSFETRPLAGTEINGAVPPPFWSPDSRFVAFDDGLGKLKKIDITGGPAQTICDVPTGTFVGGSWNDDGVIIFAKNFAGVMRVSAAGGVASPLTRVDSAGREVTQVFPFFLPDGRHFLYFRFSNGPDGSGLYVGSLDAKPEEQSSAKLLATTSGTVVFVTSDSASAAGRGQLLFRREGTLMAQTFDARTLSLSGDALPVATQLGSFLANGFFSASNTGVLVYRTGGAARQNSQPTWFDRQGTRLGTSGDPGNYVSLTLSPNAARAAAVRLDVQTVIQDLWLLDFAPGTSTRLTFGPSFVSSPVWSPDGSRVVFGLSPDGGPFDLYQKPVNGATDEEILLESTGDKAATSWSRDGRSLLYTESNPKSKNDVWLLSLDGRKAMPAVNSVFNEEQGRFSADGRVAYVSDESGRSQVYVRESSASAAGGKQVVSNTGGSAPRWRADGKELFYLAPDGTIMAVDVTTGPVFKTGPPKPSFKLPPGVTAWDMTADGTRVLAAVPLEQGVQAPFTVVLNWQEGLKK